MNRAVLIITILFCLPSGGASAVPPGFSDELLNTQSFTIGLGTLPDGRILITLRPGHLMIYTTTGNAALATAGTGDVLTGVIAGLVAQFHKANLGSGSRQISAGEQGGLSLFECARLGVHLHGLAADLWVDEHGEAGLTAGDLVDWMPAAHAALRAVTN